MDSITYGMALAFFASAYAEQAEECEKPLRGEILDQLPELVDPAAQHAAQTLTFDLTREHRASLYRLYRENSGGLDQERYGFYAAMQAMGHGVGLKDYGVGLRVPYVEFGSHSLERDYFTSNNEGE